MRRFYLLFFALAAAAAIVFAAGCASPNLDAQTKASVRRVYIEPIVPAKATVVPAEGGALAVTGGKSAPAPQNAAQRFQDIVDATVPLGPLLQEQAKKELSAKGYEVVQSAAQSDAKLRFVVYHGLGVAGAMSNGRGIAMTVNMEMVRTSDASRLAFAIANQVKDPGSLAKVKAAPFDAWFSDHALVADQYKVVGPALVSQALAGL